MPLALQAKLLRVLETRQFFKVGSTVPTEADVRIISATNRHLQEEVENGKFRDETREWLPLSAFDLASVEKLHIQRVLNYTKGNKVEAARLLNIGLTTVYRKMEEYGLG